MLGSDEILGVLADAVQFGSGGVWIKVGGRSMGAAYGDVSEIRIVPSGSGRIACGRLVVYQRDGRWVVHRVMRRRIVGGAVAYCVKGDGLSQPEEPDVRADEIRGIVAGLRFSDGATVDAGSFVSRLRGWWTVLRFRGREWLAPAGKGPEPCRPG